MRTQFYTVMFFHVKDDRILDHECGIQFKGRLTESQMKQKANLKCFDKLGAFVDYITGFAGEKISGEIYGSYQDGGKLEMKPGFEFLTQNQSAL